MFKRSCLTATLSILFGSFTVGMTGTATAGVYLQENFSGLSQNDTCAMGRCFRPPDTMGAMGNNTYLEAINGGVAVYNRNGTLAAPIQSDTTFWANAGSPFAASASGDSRVLFDPTSQRWFVSAFTGDPTGNKILLAVSQTADPLGPWKSTSFVGDRTGFADYPTLGVDSKGVYIGTHDFGSSFSTSLFSIPKADLLGATPTLANMTRFDNMDVNVSGYSIQGAVNFGSGSSGNIVAVSNTTFAYNRFNVIGADGAGATLSAVTQLNFDPYNGTHGGRQPDGTAAVDTLDDRLSSNVYQVGDHLFMTHTVGDASGNAQIAWEIVSASTGAIIASGMIADPNYDYYQSSITANANGDFVIDYNRSGYGADGTISSFAQVFHLNADGTTDLGGTLRLATGLVNNYHCGKNGNGLASGPFPSEGDNDSPPQDKFGPGVDPGPDASNACRERWGDYSSVTIDPNDINSFWAVTEIPIGYVPVYDASGNFLYNVARWGTQVSEITIPEPGSIFLLGLGLAGVARLRRKTQKA